MADPKKYWFIQPPNWTTGLPVTWQGWTWLIGAFALEIRVTRELQGVMTFRTITVASCAG